ncbi:MAG TPA: permease prefix domain 1-containing protein, partial [Thermoanaerobaculia bacterium]|nr:permease prefix domain 1-containing protein [Thermoanaerobaculia bacterium]
MRQHVELEAEDLARHGVPAAEARRRALVAFGGVDRYREEGWEARRPRWLEDLGRDLRYSVRTLRRSPAFTVMAVLCIRLGIGVTTTIFAVVEGVLLRPLPYARAE